MSPPRKIDAESSWTHPKSYFIPKVISRAQMWPFRKNISFWLCPNLSMKPKCPNLGPARSLRWGRNPPNKNWFSVLILIKSLFPRQNCSFVVKTIIVCVRIIESSWCLQQQVSTSMFLICACRDLFRRFVLHSPSFLLLPPLLSLRPWPIWALNHIVENMKSEEEAKNSVQEGFAFPDSYRTGNFSRISFSKILEKVPSNRTSHEFWSYPQLQKTEIQNIMPAT